MSVIVNSISKHFGAQKAVDELTFEAHPGQILGLLGPNGAGKTTTMKLICCYLQATSGTATVEGYDINESPLEVRRNIGYLPEHNPLYDEMYVKEFLHFIANIHKLDNKTNRIKDIIELTGLEKEQNKIIGSLSKGYRQRVGLSQAIMHDPKVLILDEPTSGLDMNQLMDIRGLIKKLGKEKTVIFSSHIMQEVQAICDRVVILNNGQKIVDESIEMLQGKMDGHQSVKVTFAEQKIDVKRFENMQMVKEVSTTKDGFIFISNGKADIRSDIFNAAVQQGLTIIEMSAEKANVEDIFRKLTKVEAHD